MTTIYSKSGTDAAISAAIDALTPVYPVQQVTLTGNLAYALPLDAPADQVISVVFTQDTAGGHTVTYDALPMAVALAAGASTVVELHPVGAGYVVRYPATGPTSGVNTGDQDLSGLVPKTTTIAGKALTGDIALAAADLADHTEATQDVVGAMVVGAGGTYDDVAGTITLPSVVTPMIANQAHRITSRVGGTMPPSANLYPIAIRYTVRYWRIGFEITAAAAGCTALLVFYRPVSGTSNVSLVASVSINLSQVSEGYFVTLPSDLLLTQGIWLVGLVPTSAIVGGTVRTGATDTLGLPQRDINNIGLYYDAFSGVGSGWVPPATVSNLNSERMLSGSPPFIMGVSR